MKKLTQVESKWTFKSVALALLQGNAVGYAQNPNIWLEDANKLTTKLQIACELYGQEDDNEKRDA